MKRSLLLLLLFVLLMSLGIASIAYGQEHKVYSVYSGEAELFASKSVTLLDGFHANGNTLRIYITSLTVQDCQPLTGIPTANQNYILTRTFKVPGVNQSNIANIRTICEENQDIQYFDGLGRLIQGVNVKASPGYNDIIQPVAYDQLGRQAIKYLPYTQIGNNAQYRPLAISEQSGFYANSTVGVTNTPNPYGISVFEASPLNRLIEQGAPGAPWQPVANSNAGHTLKTDYSFNMANEVKKWSINNNDDGAIAGIYQPGSLYKNVIKDENWQQADLKKGTVEEFKDQEGRVVLKRTWEDDTKSLNTYYVYDDFGNLRYVLPPAVNENGPSTINSFTEAISDPVFDKFIYGYRYDGRRRVIKKKIPGKGWDYLVYNQLDQLVFSQDANQRATNKWLFTKYDSFGRVISTGLYTDGSSPEVLQTTVNNQSSLWEIRNVEVATGVFDYTSLSMPINNTVNLSVNYYDDYNFPNNTFGPPTGQQVTGAGVKTLLTGSKVNVLGTTNMLLTVNYYDDEARLVQIKADNHLNGTEVIDNSYNFIGELTASKRVHRTPALGAGGLTIANSYEYDHMGRKLSNKQKINSDAEVVINKFEYNELGQLKTKSLHSTDQGNSFLQTTNLTYNERGWLKTSSSNEFSMQLDYQDGAFPQYNGNIANQRWSTAGSSQSIFTYQYDRLNRLFKAEVSPTLMSEVITYDVMGNITSMNRDNVGPMVYTYKENNKSNQLDAVDGLTTTSYIYDPNGNATTDGRNGMGLTYNYLNLPITATRTGAAPLSLAYTYDANGQKLKKVSSTMGTTDYVGGIQYQGGSIEFIQTEEGVARRSGSNYVYEYNLTDHLGNVRYTFGTSGGTLNKLQTDDYYAFGKRNPTFANANDNKYLYNGKELQDELGQYDYGARFYDPVVGRWNVVDPLAEHSQSLNPYHYCSNNPMNRIDPDGRCDEWNCPHKGGFNNEMSPVENILRDAWDKAVSGLVTVGTYLANKATNGTYPVLEANFTYGANGRVGKLAPVGGSPDLAALGGAANVASVIPTAGPTAGLMAKVVGGKTAIVEGVKEGLSLEVQAKKISTELNEGRNSVTIGTPNKQIRYDLAGKEHLNIPTPHTQVYNKNFVDGVQRNISKATKHPTPITQQEIRLIRKFLENQK